ncbi:MAG TPA: L,D-transpeptidase family protein [Beijerinckiaceae bacterium]|jgi:murein L,D-transpeptidase YcbB/YkuD
MAFLRSGCVVLICAGVSGALAAERPAKVQVAQAQPNAAPSAVILPAPPAGGSFALPADRAEKPAASPPPATSAPTAQPGSSATAPAAKPKAPAPLRFATVSKDPRPTLDPDTFVNTTRAAERYHAVAAAGGWGVLPKGTALKAGDKGELVSKLKERLAASDDLPRDALPGDAFDPAVVQAVKRLQGRHGLPETGLAGPRTVEALNVPADVRARQLSGSAQRLAGSRFPFGERYVVVNIPSATVEAVEKGQVVRRYVAVVGKKDRASPTVMARIQTVNFNPTWTVPASLIRKDIIPHVRKEPGYLARMKIRILDGQGREIDPASIDWSTEKAADYTLRQDPGAGNSLGQVRIDMPNRHAVYMHDTPTKKLFSRDDRFHSSGCVRVGNVREFVAWLLEGTPGPGGDAASWAVPEIDAAIAAAKRQDVALKRSVPVAWVYMTGFATPDGMVHFRGDVYGLDAESAPAKSEPTIADLITSSIGPKPTF